MNIEIINQKLKELNINITEYILMLLIEKGFISSVKKELPIGYELLLPSDSEKYTNSLAFFNKIQRLLEKDDDKVLFKEIFSLYPQKAGTRALRNKDYDMTTLNCKTLYKKYKNAVDKYSHDIIKKGLINYIKSVNNLYIVGMEVFFNQELYIQYKDDTKITTRGLKL